VPSVDSVQKVEKVEIPQETIPAAPKKEISIRDLGAEVRKKELSKKSEKNKDISDDHKKSIGKFVVFAISYLILTIVVGMGLGYLLAKFL